MITKAGKPVAALVDVALFERLQKLDDEFEELAKTLAEAFQEVPADKGMNWVDEAVRAARRKTTDR